MRIRFKKSDLIQPSAVVNSVAPPSSPTPVLCNVLIRTEHDNLVSLVAADYETRVCVYVPAEVEERGSVLIPAKTFFDLVKELPNESDVLIEASTGTATVTAGDVRAKLQTMPVMDYPHAQEFEPIFKLNLPQKAFRKLISAVSFAIAIRETRKIFLGCCFNFLPDALLALATDGKMMAMSQMPIDAEGIPEGRQAILPRKLLNEVFNVLGEEGNVDFQLAERSVSMTIGNITFVSNLIDGVFPHWESVMPKSFAHTIRFPKIAVSNALRRAGVMMDIKTQSIKLEINSSMLRVKVDSYERGTFDESIVVANELEKKYLIGLNYSYLSNVVKSLLDDEILMRCNEPNKPVIFTVASDPDTRYLVMPVKLPREIEEDESSSAETADGLDVPPNPTEYNDED